MQVGKWGDSLAVRLPDAVVELLDLKEGDDITIAVAGGRTLEVAKGTTVEEAVARMAAMKLPLPPGWRFNRDEANER